MKSKDYVIIISVTQYNRSTECIGEGENQSTIVTPLKVKPITTEALFWPVAGMFFLYLKV